MVEFKKEIINTNQKSWEFSINLKKYCRNLTYKNYTSTKNHKFTKWNDLMENIQYNNMQKEQKLHNGNLKELIICYKCGQKSHIKKICSIFKFKKLHLKTKNMISHQEFNNIKSDNVRIFNMIHTAFFFEKKY